MRILQELPPGSRVFSCHSSLNIILNNQEPATSLWISLWPVPQALPLSMSLAAFCWTPSSGSLLTLQTQVTRAMASLSSSCSSYSCCHFFNLLQIKMAFCSDSFLVSKFQSFGVLCFCSVWPFHSCHHHLRCFPELLNNPLACPATFSPPCDHPPGSCSVGCMVQ